jgi:signal transduction histidine kinase
MAMNGTARLEKLMPQTRRAFALGVGLALSVLAATVVSGVWFVRGLVREQIAQRDAEALHATTLMEQLDAASLNGKELRTDEQIGFDAAILASRLRGVMGIRFYDTNGVFSDSFPATILPLPLGRGALESVRALKPHSRFIPNTPLSVVFIYRPEFATGNVARVPTLEVTVPLHRRDTTKLAGAAQFIIEGQSIAEEYARLDRRLTQMAAITFSIAGWLLVAMLWPAFRRVAKLNRDLALRGERLQRANEELALAARASALGAVSAHLMHGLKNPLASLSQFVSRHSNGPAERVDEDWQDALSASRRMQSLVEQTLEVLADARGEPAYELSVKELVSDVQKRVATAAERRKVRLEVQAQGTCTLSSRTANLTSLVLVNLLENAIQATPAGGTVLLSVARESARLRFRVKDQGPGFPEHLRPHLFLPCKSTREGGSGIGLAICKQIADHLGAKLDLADSSSLGCVFILELPVSACQESTADRPVPDLRSSCQR